MRVLLLLLLCCGQALAAIPKPLQPWQDWVLADQSFRHCPLNLGTEAKGAGDFSCLWYRPLVLNLDDGAGQFSMAVSRYSDGWVWLPGEPGQSWPRQMQLDGKALALMNVGGRPALWVPKGEHRIDGHFGWSQLPAKLRLPQGAALIQLSLGGKGVGQPQREGGYLLLTREAQGSDSHQASLDVSVFRHFEDGLPATLTTVLRLDIAGPARELNLGKVLPDGYSVLTLQSELPARFDADGTLRIQALAGNKSLTIRARSLEAVSQLGFVQNGLMPGQEVWSVATDSRLRSLRFEGASPIDPNQTRMPAGWRQLPAFVLSPSQGLALVEQGRGRQQSQNSLHLSRDLWLDFSGKGYHFSDIISGTMRSDWRLDMAAPYQLQQARQAERALPLTEGPNGQRGIELRAQNLELDASGTLDNSNHWPVAGWQSGFDGVDMTVNLPPGYRLLGASGPQQVSYSWLGAWNLLDMFVLVLSAVLVFKLSGWRWALVAGVALAALFHEPGMPVWLVLNAAIALLLARELGGKFAKATAAYQWASLALLVLALLPFASHQVRALLHPQLEWPIQGQDRSMYEMPLPGTASAPQELERIEVTSSRLRSPNAPAKALADAAYQAPPVERYTDNQVASAGSGLPDWSWHRYQLRWSGPVAAGDSLHLWVLPYWLRAPLIALAMLGLFAWLARELKGRWPAKGAALVLAIMLSPLPKPAEAALPDGQMLDALKARLTAPPECAPYCGALDEATLSAQDGRWQLELSAEALASSALPIPGAPGSWLPDTVLVDGAPSATSWHDGALWVALAKGRHQLTLSGPAADADRVNLGFRLVPNRVLVTLRGWQAQGLSSGHLSGNSLVLEREIKDAADFKTGKLSVKPYVKVVRTLHFGERWSVDTQVIRMAPESQPFSVFIPLLSGERLQSELPQGPDGVQLNFAAGQSQLRFTGILERREHLTLTAPPLSQRVEQWRLEPTNLWRLEATGTPQIQSLNGEDWQQLYQPRGGETLAVTLSRPRQLGGDTLAFDGVTLSLDVAGHGSSGQLVIEYRATLGGKHKLTLPAGWELVDARQDGAPLVLAKDADALTLPILPGEHNLGIKLRSTQGVSLVQGLPDINLGLGAANIDINLSLGSDRWLLFTHGPVMGPVVLYWSALVVFLLLAWGLSRTALLPIGFGDLLLLGLGLSTQAWSVLVLVLAWLMAVKWRAGKADLLDKSWFNPLQVALLILSALALLLLVSSVPAGLLSRPDMMVSNASGNPLHWYQDLSDGALPALWALNLPLWVYKGAMLLWAIWLSFAVIRWVRLAWQGLNVGGFWHKKVWSDIATTAQPGEMPKPKD